MIGLRRAVRAVFVCGTISGRKKGEWLRHGFVAIGLLPIPERVVTIAVSKDERRWLFGSTLPYGGDGSIELGEEGLRTVKTFRQAEDPALIAELARFLVGSGVEPVVSPS